MARVGKGGGGKLHRCFGRVLLKDIEIGVMYKYSLDSVKAKVKQSRYSPGGAQGVPGS